MSQTECRAIRQVITNILGKYGFDTESASRIASEIADGILALRPTKRRQAVAQDLFPIAKAIAEVCNMDLAANRGQLFHEARQLSQAVPPATPELIMAHYGDSADRAKSNWYNDDWRGRERQYPKPSYIRQTWAQMVNNQMRNNDAKQVVIVR